MGFLLKNILKIHKGSMIFPFYHSVTDEELPHIKNLYSVKKIEVFKQELTYLLKHFQPLNLEEVLHFTSTNTQPKKPSFFLSFDDGLQECYTIIAPILKEKKIPAAFFINTDFLDNYNLMYRYKQSLIVEKLKDLEIAKILNYSSEDILNLKHSDSSLLDRLALELGINFNHFLQEKEPYMTSEQVLELKNQGFYIGSHSINHPYYHEISLQEQLHQTLQSLDFLQHTFELEYRIFSFPFTDFGVNKEFFERVKPNLDIVFSTGGIKKDEYEWNYKRFSMDKSQNIQNYLPYLVGKSALKNIFQIRNIQTH